MTNYYDEKLNADKLFAVYQTAYPRVRQYLNAEIDFVRGRLRPTDNVLEVGAGYGRIIKELAAAATRLTGVDISASSVALGREYLRDCPNCEMLVMDANQLHFTENFDAILCLQNALSAMKVPPAHLLRQCFGLLNPGGKAYFSTYSGKFWPHRLDWFKEQADKGLLGEMDMEKTQNGVIICKDGFNAVTFSAADLTALGEASGYPYRLEEVDESSLFLILNKE